MSTSTKLEALTPILTVSNFRAGLAYYTQKLGFKKMWAYGKPPRFGCISRDGYEIFISQTPQKNHDSTLYFTTGDVDALHRQFRGRGATIGGPPKDQPWEMREFDVKDPDGNTLFFGQYRPQKSLLVKRATVRARLEKRIAAVVADLAKETKRTVGEVLEETLLHSFEAVPGQEGQAVASPHTAHTLKLIARLKMKHGLDYDTHANYRFKER